jgi:glucose-6-phosphate 1-epimerase
MLVLIILTIQKQVFGPPPKSGHATSALPQHGFARSTTWEYLGKSTSESQPVSSNKGDDSIQLDFGLDHSSLSPEASKAWPIEFALVYSVTLSKEGLKTTLIVRNEGKETFDFQTLLHTYLRVKVRQSS